MKIEQLSLFECVNVFDTEKAIWLPGVDNHKYCEVLAYIPKEALSPMEQGYSGPGNQLKEYRHKIWGAHACAIWDYLGTNAKWGEATKLLEEYREANLPLKMRITDWRMDSFIETQIVEYLEG